MSIVSSSAGAAGRKAAYSSSSSSSSSSYTAYGKHRPPAASRFKRSKRGTTDDSGERHHAFMYSHSKGQHILKNPGIVRDMIDKAGVKETDIVLEVGPGTGNLTAQLLTRCKQVIALEVDARMVSELRKRFLGTEFEQRLKIIHGDAIKTDFPFFNVCVTNTPYQISSPLIFKLLAHRPHFRCAVLMLQDEFARRMVARPGDYVWSRLSINTQLLSRVSYLKKVGKSNFRPPPKVESALIRIEPRRPPPPINFVQWDGLIRICFSKRHRLLQKIFSNKTNLESLRINHETFCKLKKISPVPDIKASVKQILVDLDLAEKRSRHLDVLDFLKLLKAFNDHHFYFK